MSEVGLNLSPDLTSSDVGEVKPITVVATAGARLSAARQELGMTLEQVADQLKLSYRQVQAIESDEFEKLPKMVIVRGFIRSYAKLLKIDPVPVIACLPSEKIGFELDTDLRPTLATPFLESRTPFLGRADNNKKYILGAVFLAFAALLFIIAQHFEQSDYFKGLFTHSDQVKPVIDPITVSLPQAASSVSADASDEAFPPDSSAQGGTVIERAARSSPEVVDNQSVLASSVEVKKTPPILATGASSTALSPIADVKQGNNQLHLKFRQDSWLQVKKETGELVTSHLAKAGTEEFFDMKDALQLRIGNAHGVDAWVRGAVLDIVPPKDTNVVNLNVK